MGVWDKLEQFDGSGADHQTEWDMWHRKFMAKARINAKPLHKALSDVPVARKDDEPGFYESLDDKELDADLSAILVEVTKGLAASLIIESDVDGKGLKAFKKLERRFGAEASGKLPRQGLIKSLLTVRCEASETKEAYMVRVRKIERDIAVGGELKLSELVEAAAILGLDPKRDANLISQYHSNIDGMELDSLVVMFKNHDVYQKAVGERGPQSSDGVALMPEGSANAIYKPGGFMDTRTCNYCKEKGHIVKDCPVLKKKEQKKAERQHEVQTPVDAKAKKKLLKQKLVKLLTEEDSDDEPAASAVSVQPAPAGAKPGAVARAAMTGDEWTAEELDSILRAVTSHVSVDMPGASAVHAQVAHIQGPFASDLSATDWDELLDVSQRVGID